MGDRRGASRRRPLSARVLGPDAAVARRDSGRSRPPARLLLGVVVLLAAVVLLPTGAGAVDDFRIAEPAAGTVLTGPFDLVVDVDASGGELIESVDAQLAGPTNRTFQLQPLGPPDAEGRQRWALRGIDPLGPAPFLNGRHQISMRPVPAAGVPGPDFRGHDVTLAVAVEGNLRATPDAADPTTVTLAWDPVDVADHIAYRIERRPDGDGGVWTTVADLADRTQTSTTDRVDEPGAYRYRLVVVRSDGDGGEVRGYSAARGVRAGPDDAGTFEPDPEPTPEPNVVPAPTTTEEPPAGGPLGRPGPVAQGEPTPETSTAGTPTQAPPPVSVQPQVPPPLAPGPPGPTVVPLDDGVFEPLLPIEGGGEIVITDSEAALVDGPTRQGGTVAVLTEDPPDRQVVLAAAVGLLLLVVAGHVRRFLGDAPTVRVRQMR